MAAKKQILRCAQDDMFKVAIRDRVHGKLPVLALPKLHTNHEPGSRCRVDQAQRIHHSIKNRRTLFATVDPMLVAAFVVMPRLIHPTVWFSPCFFRHWARALNQVMF